MYSLIPAIASTTAAPEIVPEGERSLTAHEIWMRITQGPGPSSIHNGLIAAGRLRANHEQRVQTLHRLAAELDDAWRGDAASAARAGAEPIRGWLADSSASLAATEDLLAAQRDAFTEVRARVQQVPAEPPRADLITEPMPWDTDIDRDLAGYHGTAQTNVDAFLDYLAASTANGEGLPAFDGPGGGSAASGSEGGSPVAGEPDWRTGPWADGMYRNRWTPPEGVAVLPAWAGNPVGEPGTVPSLSTTLPAAALPTAPHVLPPGTATPPTTLPTTLPAAAPVSVPSLPVPGFRQGGRQGDTDAAGYRSRTPGGSRGPLATVPDLGDLPTGGGDFGPGAGSGSTDGPTGIGPGRGTPGGGAPGMGQHPVLGTGSGSGVATGGQGAAPGGGMFGGAPGAGGFGAGGGYGQERQGRFLLSEDTESLFGTSELTAPPVLGE